MRLNFMFLKDKEKFRSFAKSAIEAEKGIAVSNATCVILCRRSLEQAVKWLYSIDPKLHIPYQENLASLIHERTFRNALNPKLFPSIRYIWEIGNQAVHSNKIIRRDDAVLALKNLFEFIKWIDYCYGDSYEEHTFDEEILLGNPNRKKAEKREESEEWKKMIEKISSQDKKLEELRHENEYLQKLMAEQKEKNTEERIYTIDQLTEAETRHKYIDLKLNEAGWSIGSDCMEEVKVYGMPNSQGIGYADYVLYGNNRKPLAVVEAKKASVDTTVGMEQAIKYADCLQKMTGQRPLIFITNGFEIEYINDARGYSRRRISGFLTKDEMQLEIDRRERIIPLSEAVIKDSISNRPYQKLAIMSVCEAIEQHHRKMLLVMATGSGKTRTAISIVDILTRHNYVKNILFLADRTALVRQAKNNFSHLLEGLTLCNLLDSKDDPNQARMIFSTYPTMMNAIDDRKNEFGEKLFTPGHFDLIIVDESHRSIYKKYQDIFNYFDAMMIGLTATPKDQVGSNTYEVYELEDGVPTYAYELEEAVKDGYLVPYSTIEVKTKIMEDGIHYYELSNEEKDQFEDTFEFDENIDKDISNSAINNWLFNKDTIYKVLDCLMEQGLKVQGGDKLGKTIIFAKSSKHAKAIVDTFQERYPEYGPNFIKQIDYSIKYSDTLIDDFSDSMKEPQIAVSVDMLDTGIDIPEILNLVFFKKVRSYAKFWQMIGRGTRLRENLFGPGMDKERFLIFDFCNNFEFFRAFKGREGNGVQESLNEKIYMLKVRIIRELQSPEYNDEDLKEYREQLVDESIKEILNLNPQSFRVKLNQRSVENFKEKLAWTNLETGSMTELKQHIAPLIRLEDTDELAKRFDCLMYTMELAMLEQKDTSKLVLTVQQTAEKLSKIHSLPKVQDQKYIIDKVITNEFWENAEIPDLEAVREALRDLICFIERTEIKIYYTNFEDYILNEEEGEPVYITNKLENYRKKVEHYLKEHSQIISVYKLRNNKPLTKTDMEELERILWNELGTREDYEREYGDTPIGHLVRKIVGLDRMAINEAFSDFLTQKKLNTNQMRFVHLMIDYIERNGFIEDKSVLMKDPFKSIGSITVLFKNDMVTAKQIMDVSDQIRENAVIAV
jgi:type I restriction enzyme R subunit